MERTLSSENFKLACESIYHHEFLVDVGMGIKLPSRSLIIAYGEGKHLWYSPGPIDDVLVQEIQSKFKKIDMIIAPNLFHHLYLKQAYEAFPGAEVYAPRGLDKKRKDLDFNRIKIFNSFEDLQIVDYFDGLVLTHHTFLRELVLFHKKTETLIFTDFSFNFSKKLPTILTGIFLRIFGAHKGLKQSRLIQKTCKYPKEFLNDCQHVFRLGDRAQKLVMCHGDIITDDLKPKWDALKKLVTKRYS